MFARHENPRIFKGQVTYPRVVMLAPFAPTRGKGTGPLVAFKPILLARAASKAVTSDPESTSAVIVARLLNDTFTNGRQSFAFRGKAAVELSTLLG